MDIPVVGTAQGNAVEDAFVKLFKLYKLWLASRRGKHWVATSRLGPSRGLSNVCMTARLALRSEMDVVLLLE